MSWYQYTCTISRNKSKKVRQGFWHIFMRNCSIANTISLVLPRISHLYSTNTFVTRLVRSMKNSLDDMRKPRVWYYNPDSMQSHYQSRTWEFDASERRRRWSLISSGTGQAQDRHGCGARPVSAIQVPYVENIRVSENIPHLIPEMRSFTIGKQDILIW